MFKKNDLGEYEMKIKGIRFVCEEPDEGFEDAAEKIAECYKARLSAIAQFLLDNGIEECFGELTPEQIVKSLGAPIIDLSAGTVLYADHGFDDDSIIEFEFDGILEEFDYLSIDG